MHTPIRTAAGALAVALTLAAGSPVASAAGHAQRKGPGHVKVDKGDKPPKEHKAPKDPKSEGAQGSQSLRQVLRDIARTDARLTKAVRASRTSRIGDHAAAVLANVAADQASLAALALAVQAPDSTVDERALRKELKDIRVQNYDKVVNDLRLAVRLAEAITEATSAVEGDAEAPAEELAAAGAALESAVAKAHLVTASSDKDELRAVEDDLRSARAALDVVRDYLDGVSEDGPVIS